MPPITERKFLAQILQLAKLFGWRTAHFRTSRTKTSWRTAVQGAGKGFPDLILLRRGRLIAAEVKAAKGRATQEQLDWLEAFRFTGYMEVYLWRPADWKSIEKILSDQ